MAEDHSSSSDEGLGEAFCKPVKKSSVKSKNSVCLKVRLGAMATDNNTTFLASARSTVTTKTIAGSKLDLALPVNYATLLTAVQELLVAYFRISLDMNAGHCLLHQPLARNGENFICTPISASFSYSSTDTLTVVVYIPPMVAYFSHLS